MILTPVAGRSIQNGPGGTGTAVRSVSNQEFRSVMDGALQSPRSLDSIFEETARAYQVPEQLLRAVAKTESNFQADAVSSCGAMGIMQLMPGTARGLGVTDAFDPEQSIRGGAKYLRQMLDRYDGNTKLALAAYNAGAGNVEKYGGVPPFAETQAYVQRVMQYMGEDIEVPAASSGQEIPAASAGELASDPFTYDDYRLFVELFFASLNAGAERSRFSL